MSGYAPSSPIELLQDRSSHGGIHHLFKHNVVFVVVEPADDTRGITTAGASGSAMRECFEDDSQGTFVDVVNNAIVDVFEGEPTGEVEGAHAILRDTGLPDRLRHEAISVFDVTPYDTCGKQAGAPIYRLLAGGYGTDPMTEMPLYMNAGMYMEPEGYTEQAATIRDLGFSGYKYRPGIGPDGGHRTTKLLSDVAGEMEVMLDTHTWWKIHGGYDRGTAEGLIIFAVERDRYWAEEPVSSDDHAGYVDLTVTGAPPVGGESGPTLDGLVVLGETDVVAFLQGDIRHHCSYTGRCPAAESYIGHDVEFVPHNFGAWVGLLASAYLVAVVPGMSLLEYPVFKNDPLLGVETDLGMYPFGLTLDITEGQPAAEDGTLSLSDESGLGIEVNFDTLGDYPLRGRPRTEFHYDED